MAKRKFKTLAQLAVRHAFYESGGSPDFDIEPIGRTRSILRRYRMVLRSSVSGASILYPTTTDDDPHDLGPTPTTRLAHFDFTGAEDYEAFRQLEPVIGMRGIDSLSYAPHALLQVWSEPVNLLQYPNKFDEAIWANLGRRYQP